MNLDPVENHGLKSLRKALKRSRFIILQRLFGLADGAVEGITEASVDMT